MLFTHKEESTISRAYVYSGFCKCYKEALLVVLLVLLWTAFYTKKRIELDFLW